MSTPKCAKTCALPPKEESHPHPQFATMRPAYLENKIELETVKPTPIDRIMYAIQKFHEWGVLAAELEAGAFGDLHIDLETLADELEAEMEEYLEAGMAEWREAED